MSSPLDYLELCRLCLVKDRVQVPIFEDDGDVHQIFLKIHACLPVKVSRDDKLPKKICDDCLCKVELFYQFWNTTASAEKQLLQWLGEVDGLEDKQQAYVTEVLDSNVMKQERGGSSDSRLDDSVMQVSGHQNMDINMIENMSIITMPAGSEQQFTTVPMGTGGTVQTVQVSRPSTQTAHNQTGVAHLQEVEVDQDDDDNMDDGCDNDDGLPVKEETDEGDGSLEQSYVSLPCDEAGPSGLQQQKISEMSEITIQQTADGDHKTGDETFGGLSGMLRQILSPSSESDELNFLHHHHQQYSSTASVLTSSLQMQPPALSHHQLVTMHEQQQQQQQQQVVYQDHVQLLTETHSCPHCGTKLTWHVRTNEINAEALLMRFTCHACSRTFLAQSHMRLQIEELPAAPQPPAAYQAPPPPPPPQQQQQQQHQQKQENNFSCERCQATFRYRTLLEKHRKMHEAAAGQDKPYSCPRCLMRFETRNLYNHHAKTHKPERASTTSSIGSATGGGGGAVTKDETLLYSGKANSSSSGGGAYSCETCAKEFPTPESLTSHKAVHRSRPLICDVCGKGFTHRKYYVVHQRIHTGERPYLCAMCGKSFTQASTLTVHRRYHTGERPYTCTLCGKGFVTRTIMLNHMKKH